MYRINQIIKSGLCLGCGLCESIATEEKCKMQLHSNGFYMPKFHKKLSRQEKADILASCPAINVRGNGEKRVWGEIRNVSESWAANNVVRKVSTSGGVVSALAGYLLEKHIVDGILHVGLKEGSYLINELKVSKNSEEILSNVGSRYAPALVFDKIKLILDKSDDTFAFIGKPCDIAGMRNYLRIHPEYEKRISFFIGIFCAGIPSLNGTKKMLELANTNETPMSLKYRGEGWPGMFEVKYKNTPTFKASYNDSWGKVLNKYVGLRCRICPDGIGLLADVVVGDSWDTKDGFPDFEEKEGRSFVLVRTLEGEKLFNSAVKDEMVVSRPLEVNKIKEMQRFQHQRRLLVGYRLVSVQILSLFLLRFSNLGIINLMMRANFKTGLLNMIGTAKRFIFKKKFI